MSRLAALAMRDLADCMDEEAADLPAGSGYQIMSAMARAHRAAAERIDERARDGTKRVPVPPEFQDGQAGSKKGRR